MGRSIALLVLTVLAGTAVGGGVFLYRTAWCVPRLQIAETRLDLGDGEPNEVRRGALRLRNTGRAPLEFTVEGSCGCTELLPKQGTVPPGGDQEISVAVQLAGHANSERSVRITVKSNDAAAAEVHCSAMATCRGPFRVTPAFINFGQLTRSQLAGAAQLVTIVPNPGTKPPDREAISIAPRTSSFRIEPVSEDHPLAFRVSLAADLEHTDFFDELEVQIAGSAAIVRVPVHVQVVEPVSVVPTTVFLRRQEGSDAYEPVDLLLIDRRKGSSIEDISIVDGPETVQLEKIGRSASSVLRLRLVARADGDLPAVLNLKCNGLDSPISVRVATGK